MGRRRAPRALRAEERALWAEIARSANPLAGKAAPARPASLAPPPPEATPVPPVPPPVPPTVDGEHRWLAPFRVGERAAPPPGAHFGPMPGPMSGPTSGAQAARRPAAPRMDARALTRMMRGKLAPEARIDLHGMTLAQAQPALTRFITGAQASGLRLVLVITGKGRGGADESRHPATARPGALRREVPLWLNRPPLAPLVLQTVPAHPRHGGDGALYVYLARHRG